MYYRIIFCSSNLLISSVTEVNFLLLFSMNCDKQFSKANTLVIKSIIEASDPMDPMDLGECHNWSAEASTSGITSSQLDSQSLQLNLPVLSQLCSRLVCWSLHWEPSLKDLICMPQPEPS